MSHEGERGSIFKKTLKNKDVKVAITENVFIVVLKIG